MDYGLKLEPGPFEMKIENLEFIDGAPIDFSPSIKEKFDLFFEGLDLSQIKIVEFNGSSVGPDYKKFEKWAAGYSTWYDAYAGTKPF